MQILFLVQKVLVLVHGAIYWLCKYISGNWNSHRKHVCFVTGDELIRHYIPAMYTGTP